MSQDDPDLTDLKKRLDMARSDAEPPAAEEYPSQAGMAWRMGLELVTTVIVALYLGYQIDLWLDSKPVVMIVFALLGFGAGIRNVIATARKLQQDFDRSDDQR